MSHPTIWRCRAYQTPLGVVRSDGALEVRLRTAAITISAGGLAHVPCPACGLVRAWRPSQLVLLDR
jgi:hypothetical protein